MAGVFLPSAQALGALHPGQAGSLRCQVPGQEFFLFKYLLRRHVNEANHSSSGVPEYYLLLHCFHILWTVMELLQLSFQVPSQFFDFHYMIASVRTGVFKVRKQETGGGTGR